MTHDELYHLLALPAGRELDAAVAEHVMGRVRPKDAIDLATVEREKALYLDGSNDPRAWYPEYYSTDLAAAHEAFKKRGTEWRIKENESGAFVSVWETDGNEWRAAALTLPLAMCRAALIVADEEQAK